MDGKTETTWRCDMGCAGEAGARELRIRELVREVGDCFDGRRNLQIW